MPAASGVRNSWGDVGITPYENAGEGIAPYTEMVGESRGHARLPLTRELSSDSKTEGETEFLQYPK